MKIEGFVALVNGGNGGVGQVVVHELLRRGAKKVYATARSVRTLIALIQAGEGQVIRLELGLTDGSVLGRSVSKSQTLPRSLKMQALR